MHNYSVRKCRASSTVIGATYNSGKVLKEMNVFVYLWSESESTDGTEAEVSIIM